MIVCLFVFRNGQVFLSAILVDFLTGEEGRGLFDCHHKTPSSYALVFCPHDLNAWNRLSNKQYWANSQFSHRPQCTLFYFQILHNNCFQFLQGITVVPREIQDNGYAKFGGANKVHYGMCECGECIVNKLFLAQFTLLSP